MHRATPIARTLLLIATTVVVLLLPRTAHAGSYWWNGTPSAGSNGFSWEQSGGYSAWSGGNRCESAPAAIPTSGYCNLRWTVPANLDALAGSIGGSYRHNNANFEQRNIVEGAGTTTLQGDATVRGYTRQWPDMGGWLAIQLINTGAPQTVSGGTQWFDASSFSINLVDPHAPVLNILAGHGGWHGAGGACIRYGHADAGSGINAVHLANVSTGEYHDAPSFASAAITTGVHQTDRTICVGPPGTGTYTFRAAVSDKSGNYAEDLFSVAFDVTAPTVSEITSGGTVVANGRTWRGSTAPGYSPTFRIDHADAHSGVASVQTFLDGAHVANAAQYTAANLAAGAHSIRFRVVDAMGNETNVTRTFAVVDDVAPTLTVASPGAGGGTEPVLDAGATDDRSGIDASTWAVTVDGAPLVATTTTTRLHAAIGALVDGAHVIVVTIRDGSGNVTTRTIDYAAESGDDIPNPTCMTCVFTWRVPTADTEVHEGEELRIGAVLARHGRPVSGTVEIRSGDATLASQPIAPSGAVDIPVRIMVPGPLTIVPPVGSGLAPVEFTYRFIADRTPPELAVASPGASGGNSPVLDVRATDVQSGIDASTWTVLVDGAPLVASSATARLQAQVGYLVDGRHTIVVSVADTRGNRASTELTYDADGGDDIPNPTSMTGIFVYSAPTATTRVEHGTAITVGAMFIKHGRPVAGRAELRTTSATLTGADISSTGGAELRATIQAAGPLVLHGPTGVGLEPVSIQYAYVAQAQPPATTTPDCTATPKPAGCTTGDGGGGGNDGGNGGDGSGGSGGAGGAGGANGSNGTNGTNGQPGAANNLALPPGCTVSNHGACPRNIVYYLTVDGRQVPFWNGLPLSESGAALDTVAPQWRLQLVQQRAGAVRRTCKVTFRMWSTELAIVNALPIGAKNRTSVVPRRAWRALHLQLDRRSTLCAQLRRVRAGRTMLVRVRVIATDKNENRSFPRTVAFRVRA